MAQSKYIVIVGCGRLGGALANQLNAYGHAVVIVDRRETAFDKLAVDFSGFKIIGDAIELHVLQEAKTSKADYLFATTTEDSTNLMVAQVARVIFNVPRVVARVFDPLREEVYRDFGIETISPTKLSAQAFLQIVE
jgi:trk system potassium uptake protein TrkA